jgi:hypothetical protein
MSALRSYSNRPRISPTKIKRQSSNIPEEYSPPSASFKPRIVSAIRIEERLLNQQVAYKKKLEALKKDLEEEKMREIRSKPKISDKSRVLAQKAEQRMLQQYIEIKEPQSAPVLVKEYSQNTAEIANQSFTSVKERQKTPNSSVYTVIETGKARKKKRTKSLLNLSVLERNEAWLEERNEKIGVLKKEKEEGDMAECTFSPKMNFKGQHTRSVKEGGSMNMSYISSSPYSIDNAYEINEQNARVEVSKMFNYKPIAPYQVNVSFKCGIDLNSFMKRAR